MNDFHATPVRWAEFCAVFEAANLAPQLQQAQADGDYESAMSLSQEFLNPWLWDHANAIDESLPKTLGFHRLGSLARVYQTLQAHLSEQTRRMLDALLLPFIGQWLAPPMNLSLRDISPEMRLLVHGGLSFAMAPERCSSVAADLGAVNWMSEVMSELSGTGISLNDQETFLGMTTELIALVSLSAQHQCGVIALFEI
jgi:hypothetical protein